MSLGTLKPFRRPATVEVGTFMACKHYDLQPLGRTVQNSLHFCKRQPNQHSELLSRADTEALVGFVHTFTAQVSDSKCLIV